MTPSASVVIDAPRRLSVARVLLALFVSCVGAPALAGPSYGPMFAEPMTKVRAGYDGICGLDRKGHIHCVGSSVPDTPPDGEFVDLSVAPWAVCGIDREGAIRCAGRRAPEFPRGKYRRVALGHGLNCALDVRATVSCINDDDDTFRRAGRFTEVHVGGSRACGLLWDDTVQCWDHEGETTYSPKGKFRQVTVETGTLTSDASCGVKDDKRVTCWGKTGSMYGGLGRTPHAWFRSISVADGLGCGIMATGGSRCWGKDPLGLGSPPSMELQEISVGQRSFACGLRKDGAVHCWGRDIRK